MSDGILEQMIEAGCSADLIAKVAGLIAQVAVLQTSEQALAVRRENDAERQRRYRASRDVTLRHVTSRDNSAYIEPTKKVSKKKEENISRKSSLRPDWSLPDEGRAFARSKGWSEAQITAEAERFRDHALSHGRKQIDWNAAWRSWVNSPLQKRGMNGATAPPPRPGSREDVRERNANAYQKLCDFVDANADDEGGGGGSGEATFGFLSGPQRPRS